MNYETQVYQGNPVMEMFFGNPKTSTIVNSGKVTKSSYTSFMGWLQSRQPAIYSALKYTRPDLINPDLPSGLGDDAQPAQEQSTLDKAIAALDKILPTYFQASAQQDLIKLNMQRAQMGLPPIDQGSISPQVNVGVSPQVQKLISYALIGGLGIAALAVYSGSRGNRRR